VGDPLDTIRREIDAEGPVTFARFMELALYGPGGFYEQPPVGPRGHFVTSPHVHPVFGELLAGAVWDLWERLERPTPVRVTEVGAGDGTLARSVLAHTEGMPLRYTAVERSPGARTALTAIEGVQVRERLDTPADLVLANELLDNLPFRVLRDGREVRIGREGDRLAEVLVPPDAELARFMSGESERVVPVGAFAFLDDVVRVLGRGYTLLIDYGGVGTTGGPVHGYRGHTLVEDVLAQPGTTDITTGVDFEQIASHAEALGLVAFPTVIQHDALLALSLREWLEDELGSQRTQLDAGDGRDAVATWSGRNQATLLVDPGALGRLRWLLLATPGLESPDWLARALERSED
jgi:SAM-dependent MidA family methyltransferase